MRARYMPTSSSDVIFPVSMASSSSETEASSIMSVVKSPSSLIFQVSVREPEYAKKDTDKMRQTHSVSV